MGASDEILLNRWTTRRDAEAFAELVRRHAAMVYATCLRVLRNTADAEEVAQECFLTLVKQTASGEFCPPKSLGGWIHTIALRRALDRLRVAGRTQSRNERLAAQGAVIVETPCDDLMEWVDEAIASLPDDLRQAVVAHFLEGQTHREIASALGVSRRTITRRVNLGIEEVRACLKRHGVIAPLAILCTALAAASAKAAPTRLTASLGKLALSGANGISPGSLTTVAGWGGMIMSFKKGCIVLFAVVLFYLGWYLRHSEANLSTVISPQKENTIPVSHIPSSDNLTTQTTQTAQTGNTKRPVHEKMTLEKETTTPPGNSEKASADTAMLEGTARIGNQPIPNERIQLVYDDSGSPINGVTGADGTYCIKGLRAGTAQVVMGFRDEAQQFRYATQKAMLEKGSVTRVDFTFVNSGSLEGRVVVDGAPASKGRVHVLVSQSTGIAENYTLELNDDGTYRFEAVSEGNAIVKVSTGPFIRTVSAIIRAGVTTQLNFNIDPKAGNTITGIVTGLAKDEETRLIAIPGRYEVPDHLSQPVLQELEALSVAQDYYPSYTLRGLDTGEYTVIAMAITAGLGQSIADFLDWRIASSVLIVQAGQENRVDFDLSGESASLPAITGTLIGTPINEKSLIIAVKGTPVIPNPLDPATRSALMQRPAAYAELRGGNTVFELRHLEPGTYTLLSFAGTEEAPLFGMAVVAVAKEKTATVDLKLEQMDKNGRRFSTGTKP